MFEFYESVNYKFVVIMPRMLQIVDILMVEFMGEYDG